VLSARRRSNRPTVVITRYTLGQLLDKLDELTGERES
jgi:hypothetical protein